MKKIAPILFLLLLAPSLCFSAQNTKKAQTQSQQSAHKATHKATAHKSTHKAAHKKVARKSKVHTKVAHKKTKTQARAHRKSTHARAHINRRIVAQANNDLDDLSIDNDDFDRFSEYQNTSSISNEKIQSLLNYATSLVGTRYKFGGFSPERGFDCSGYVQYVYKHELGISLPHNAAAISKTGTYISYPDLRPGDLVLFSTWRQRLNHVGIYLGNNRFAHASSTRTGFVQISDLRNYYWAKRFRGARRLNDLA